MTRIIDDMPPPLRIGLIGLGNVGAELARLLLTRGGAFAASPGKKLSLAAVCARSRQRDRGVDLSAIPWENDPLALTHRTDVDVVVELVGGADDPALSIAQSALAGGKHLVSANKALMASHGTELALTAETSGAALFYEAAICAGIPVVKILREGLAGNRLTRVAGVLNGTCNFILSEMESSGMPREAALERAQTLGYAETDATMDISGMDAAQKLALLCAIAFGVTPECEGFPVEGIARISLADVTMAKEFGYRIRLLAAAEQRDGALHRFVRPVLAPASGALGSLQGADNAIAIEADLAGPIHIRGAGAGAASTASALLSDLLDIASGRGGFVFARPAARLQKCLPVQDEAKLPLYVRFPAPGGAGSMDHSVASAMRPLGERGIAFSASGGAEAGSDGFLVSAITHPVSRRDLCKALTSAYGEGICEAALVMAVL